MPNDQSAEKSALLLSLGATVTLVPPAPIVDPQQFVNLARRLAVAQQPGSGSGRGFFADQFENSANWRAHHDSTGPEILAQCGGALDAFVAGAGTGGTLSGVARYLVPRLPRLRVVLADPQGSGLYNRVKYGVMFDPREREGTRRRSQVDSIVEGIGINRVTANFEAGAALVSDAVRVGDREAMAMARFLVEQEGLFVGSSSAVNCVAAVRTALEMGPGHRIVTILCDGGQRHLSKFWAKTAEMGGDEEMTLEGVLGAEKRGEVGGRERGGGGEGQSGG